MANEVATGGTITVDTPTLVEHTFTSGGTFSLIDPGTIPVDYLVQGAGGSGSPGTNGVWYGGGGAGGQAKTGTALDVSSDQTVTIGVGGAGVSGNGTDGLPGGSSSFGAITATGGAGQDASTGVGASNDDFSGGAAGPGTDAGGGAGSGEAGNSSPSTGGDGVLWNGTRTGGGGGGVTSGSPQAGGLGGGGAANLTNGVAGTANSGGGGGGTSATGTSGAGGSGKVVVRYNPNDFTPAGPTPASVDAVGDVPAVTITPRGRTIPLTAAVDAVGAVPAVVLSISGPPVDLTSESVDAVGGVPAVTVTLGKLVDLTGESVAAVGGVPTVTVVTASSTITLTDAVDAVGAVPAVVLSISGPPVAAVAVDAVGAVPAVLVEVVINVDTVPAPAVTGPFIQTGAVDDTFEVETIPGAGVATGPLWIANDDADPFTPNITVKLFEEDGVTEVAGDLLANAFSVSWMDELNGTGYGTLSMPMSETAAVAELTLHRLVRCYVGAVHAFSWQIEDQPKILDVASDEEYGQVLQVRGRGWAVILDELIVYPPIPVGETEVDLTSPFLGPDRVFSFASPDYPDLWGTPSDWPNVQSVDRYETLHPERFERVETYEGVWENLPAPVGFPWPNSEVFPQITNPAQNAAYWIWPSVNAYQDGWGFFIGDFYPHGWQGADKFRPITWTTTADNMFTFFIDGTPLLGESLDQFMWKGWKEFTSTIMKDRTYRVACAVKNLETGKPNPAGWLMAATYADDGGNIEDWAFTTNGDWVGYYSPSVWPGWTAGQIMLKLIDESNNRRGVNPVEHEMNYGFTETRGSDGQPWTVTIDGEKTEQIPWFSVSMGSSYLEALDQLQQNGWVNWRMSPGGLTLQMWSYDSVSIGESEAVFVSSMLDPVEWSEAETNIVSLDRAGDQSFVNVLLVSYEAGFIEVVDQDSVDADGRHEDVLKSDATDEVEAIRVGKHELEHRGRDAEGGAIVMEIEPADVPERAGPSAGYTDVPYVNGLLPGALVRVPALDGVGDSDPTYPKTRQVQVLSISVKSDSEGNPTFILELNKRWPVQDRDTNRLLRSIGGKSLGSAGTRGKVT